MSPDMRLNRKSHSMCAGYGLAANYTSPWASIESATFTKPAMLAPRT